MFLLLPNVFSKMLVDAVSFFRGYGRNTVFFILGEFCFVSLIAM